MCGRYYRRSDKQRLAEAFRTGLPTTFEILPAWNVCPQSMQPIVRLNDETQERELAQLRWGFIPFWAKDAKIAYTTINAKSETVATSAMFREALKRRRCLVPADGFFEWQKLDAKNKQPWAIGLANDAPFAFAGLWERWKDKVTQQPLETFTILTTEPNELTAPIHNRMPVILAPRDYERWLAPADPAQLPVDLLRPRPADEMTAWKVANVANDAAPNPDWL